MRPGRPVACRAVFRRCAAALLATALAAVAAGGCSGGNAKTGDEAVPSGDVQGRKASGGVLIGPAPEGIAGVEAFRVDSRNHSEEPLDYDHEPPVGGDHFPVPSTCGFYGADHPPDELVVHDLEHGAVWVAYDPGLPTAGRDALRKLVGQQAKVIATPHDGLDKPLVLTAWARQLGVDNPDDPRVQKFIDTYRNSENAPEPNNPCQGIGQPEVASPTS